MRKVLGMALLLIGASTVVMAFPSAPEIDPGSGVSALALLSGALMFIRGRKKK